MNYTVDYFIKKFEAIPENLWCVGRLHLGDKHCAWGHCGIQGAATDEGRALSELFINIDVDVALVNDGYYPQYKQPTPRQRILAALYDVRATIRSVDEANQLIKQERYKTESSV